MIPDRCEALIDRRLIPGEAEDDALREIEQIIAGLPALDGRVSIDRLVPTTGVASETLLITRWSSSLPRRSNGYTDADPN